MPDRAGAARVLDRTRILHQVFDRHVPFLRHREGTSSRVSTGQASKISCVAPGRDGAPIDGFGIGTSLAVATDAPALDCAYKLQEYAGRPKRKLSEGKATWPGRKQVWRRYHDDGTIAGDVIALADETIPGEKLLRPVMRGGKCLGDVLTVHQARTRAASCLARLPKALKRLEPRSVPVEISHGIRRLAADMDAALGREPAKGHMA